jgi:hypothetical protein
VEGTNPERVGVGLTNLLGWGAKAGLSKFTPSALGSSVHKSRGSACYESVRVANILKVYDFKLKGVRHLLHLCLE